MTASSPRRRAAPQPLTAPRPRVLYVVYWGAAEPLGQSLVVPAVMRLAGLGIDLTLVTFEKPQDLAREAEQARIRAELQNAGVAWRPLRYHKRPKWPATAFDMGHAVAQGLRAAVRRRPDVIHARTFVGGAIGLPLARLLGARLIYHNEGFYPDEQVDGGVWRAGSPAHRLATAVEQKLYATADALLALSVHARERLEDLPAVRHRGVPVRVVPSCVDLERFRPVQVGHRPAGDLRLVYVGSVGNRYELGWAGELAAAAVRRLGAVHLRVLSPAPSELVTRTLDAVGLPRAAWSLARVPYASMPAELAGHDAGLMMLRPGPSAQGCSPTKVGEYWACGLPVVTTRGVSDLDDILTRHPVGVLLDPTPEGYARAVEDLLRLRGRADVVQRCRAAAETYYALGPACDEQARLYRELSRGA